MVDEKLAEMDSEELARVCAGICEEGKAEELLLYDVRESSLLADFYMICTGTSGPHLRAIQGRLRKTLNERGLLPRGVDGDDQSHWVVMDYGVVLVHIMDAERRGFYSMEELWDDSHVVYRGGTAASDAETSPVTYEWKP